MQISELKKSFWGYSKESVYQYVVSMNESYSQTILEKETECEKRIEELQNQNAELEQSLAALRAEYEAYRKAHPAAAPAAQPKNSPPPAPKPPKPPMPETKRQPGVWDRLVQTALGRGSAPASAAPCPRAEAAKPPQTEWLKPSEPVKPAPPKPQEAMKPAVPPASSPEPHNMTLFSRKKQEDSSWQGNE